MDHPARHDTALDAPDLAQRAGSSDRTVMNRLSGADLAIPVSATSIKITFAPGLSAQ